MTYVTDEFVTDIMNDMKALLPTVTFNFSHSNLMTMLDGIVAHTFRLESYFMDVQENFMLLCLRTTDYLTMEEITIPLSNEEKEFYQNEPEWKDNHFRRGHIAISLACSKHRLYLPTQKLLKKMFHLYAYQNGLEKFK